MINCPKCGAENGVGSIFCRSCGGRLNLDEIKPTDLAEDRGGSFKSALKTVGRFLKVAFLLLLVLVLVGLFVPPRDKLGSYSLTRLALRQARGKVSAMARDRLEPREYTFSADELNGLADMYGGFLEGKLENEGGKTSHTQVRGDILKTENVHLRLLHGGYLKCTMKSTLMKKVPLYTMALFRLDADEDGLDVSVVSAKVGRVPMMGPAKAFPLGRMEGILALGLEKIEAAAPNARAVESTPEELTVTVGP